MIKHKDPGLEWKARKWTAFIVAMMLEKLHGEESAHSWLWGMTPFPATVPRWDESFFGLIAALAPRPFHTKLMRHMEERVDREIDRAMKVAKARQ